MKVSLRWGKKCGILDAKSEVVMRLGGTEAETILFPRSLTAERLRAQPSKSSTDLVTLGEPLAPVCVSHACKTRVITRLP